MRETCARSHLHPYPHPHLHIHTQWRPHCAAIAEKLVEEHTTYTELFELFDSKLRARDIFYLDRVPMVWQGLPVAVGPVQTASAVEDSKAEGPANPPPHDTKGKAQNALRNFGKLDKTVAVWI